MDRAIDIPHMGAGKIAPLLQKHAAKVSEDQSIVEVGSWLGRGTRCLLRQKGELFVYDRFRASQSEVMKAKAFGVHLTARQNTLPWVKSHLPEGIHFRRGEIMKATYSGPQIGMYVDDASKQGKVWNHSMRVFEPYFVKGAILFLMDYDFPSCTVQREYSKRWTMLDRKVNGTSCAIFRVESG